MGKFDTLLNNEIVLQLSEVLQDESLCLVGGAVRDCLENIDYSLDLDFSTKLNPEVVLSKLEAAGLPAYRAIRRGTIFTHIHSERVDVTTFRNPTKEDEYVETVEEDLAARDFTINAMALRIKTEEFIDPFNGHTDLIKGIVRCVGDPHRRFTEDPHRLIRLVRFSEANGRACESGTRTAALELSDLITTVVPERLGMEFLKIVTSKYPGRGIKGLLDMGLLKHLIPELVNCVGCTQNKYHLYDVFEHTLAVLDAIPSDSTHARLAAVFHDIGKPLCKTIKEDGGASFLKHEIHSEEICREVLHRLKFSNFAVSSIARLVAEHMRSIHGGKKSIRKLIKDLDFPYMALDDWLTLKEADLVHGGRPETVELEREWIQFIDLLDLVRYEEPKTTNIRTLAINGTDIIGLGFKEGPIVGEIIRYLEDLVLESPAINTKEQLLVKLQEKFPSP